MTLPTDEDPNEELDREPTQVTRLLNDASEKTSRAREAMQAAVRRAERARRKRNSERNLHAVLDPTLPRVADG